MSPASPTAPVACRLCGTPTPALFSATVLNRYVVPYHYCRGCDHVFVDQPTWLEEAYTEALAAEDTDVAARNIFTALRLAAFCYAVLGDRGEGKFVDVGGGYGLLTRLMRDLGYDYYWSDRYAKNLFARGFDANVREGASTAVSAIEVLEHLPDPRAFIRRTLAEQRSDTLVFTTEVFADGHPPAPADWSYYAFSTGQHIAFFSRRGLDRLARQLGMWYYPAGRLHVFSARRLPRWKLWLASRMPLAVPLALLAAARLGSRRGRDQVLVRRQNTGAQA